MEENLKYPIGSTLRRMLANVTATNKKLYFYFLIYTLAGGIYPFFAVLLPKYLLTEVTGVDGTIEGILKIALIFLGLMAAFGFVRTFTNSIAYPAITYLRLDYLRDTFDKLVSVNYQHMEDAKFFEKNERALQANSSNDNGVEGVYHKLFEVGPVLLTALGLLVVIGRLNIWILLGLLFNIAIGIWVRRSVHKYNYRRKEDVAHAERRMQYYYNTTHDFGYGKDIRLYRFQDRINENYSKEVKGFLKIQKSIKNREFSLGLLEVFTFLISNGLTYAVLIYKTANGMPIADFSMYLTAVTSLTVMLNQVSEQFTFILNEGQYVYDFYTFLDTDMGDKNLKEKSESAKRLKPGETLEIVFDNVSFCYPGTEKYIFKHLNFTINQGEKLAIVGINGAGKTTLVKLMTGLFPVTEGVIRINGIPISDFNKKDLYAMFSAVFQDINVLAYTIKENIACSSLDGNEDRVRKVLEKVGLKKKIDSLPKGIEQTMLKVIEEDGVEFSGGESQKLAIARALYKDARMVIMDEPTAALDALAEAEIYENFSDLVKGKTAVYISHRLASTKFCDKIALFDGDGLKEYGNHEELMNAKGEYYNMFMIQGKYYNEEVAVSE